MTEHISLAAAFGVAMGGNAADLGLALDRLGLGMDLNRGE
jgi:hypothetical protein